MNIKLHNSLDEILSDDDIITLEEVAEKLRIYLNEKAEAKRELEEKKASVLNKFFTDGHNYYKVISTKSSSPDPDVVTCLKIPKAASYFVDDNKINIINNINIDSIYVYDFGVFAKEITWNEFKDGINNFAVKLALTELTEREARRFCGEEV